MGTRSDELKADIENTRADLTGTMDEMGERVSPGRILSRRTGYVKAKAVSVREAVMGASGRATDVGANIVGQAHDVAGQTKDLLGAAGAAALRAPGTVAESTQGNPMAAGIIAFGAGLLLASLISASDIEQRAAGDLLDKAQPALDHARAAAQEVVEDLKVTVSDAAQEVRASATDALATVQEQVAGAREEVRSSATDAVSDVKDQVQVSAGSLRESDVNE